MSKIKVNQIQNLDETLTSTIDDIIQACNNVNAGSYLTQTEIQSLIDAAGTGGGLTEQNVLDLLTANNYLTQTGIQSLIDSSTTSFQDQTEVQALIDTSIIDFLNQTEIQALIDSSTTSFQDQTEVQALIDTSIIDFLNQTEIQALIDSSTTNFLTQTEIEALGYLTSSEVSTQINNTVGIDFNTKIGDTVISIQGTDQNDTDLCTKNFIERDKDFKVTEQDNFLFSEILFQNNSKLSADFENDVLYEYVNDDDSQLYVPIGYTNPVEFSPSAYGLIFDNTNGEVSIVNSDTASKTSTTPFTPLPSGVIGNATIIELDFDFKENAFTQYIDYLFYSRGQDSFVYVQVDKNFGSPTILNVTEFNLGGTPSATLGVNLYSNTSDGSCSFYLIANDDIIYDVQVDATGTVSSKAQFLDLLGTDYNIIQDTLENQLSFSNQPVLTKDFNDGYQNTIRLFDKNRSAFYLPFHNIFDNGGTITEERASISFKSDQGGLKEKRIYLYDNPEFPGDELEAFVIKTNADFTGGGLVVDLTVDGIPVLSQYSVPNASASGGLKFIDFEAEYFGSGASPSISPPLFDSSVGQYYFILDSTTSFDIFFDTNFNGSYGNQFETEFLLGTESIDGTSVNIETSLNTIEHPTASVVGDIVNYADFSKEISSIVNYESGNFENYKIKQEFFQSINNADSNQNFSFSAFKYKDGIIQLMFFIDNAMLGSLLGNETAYSSSFRVIYHDAIDNSLICQIGNDIKKIKMLKDHLTISDTNDYFSHQNYTITDDIFLVQTSPITGYSENSFNILGKNINEYYTAHLDDLELNMQYLPAFFFIPSYNNSITSSDLEFFNLTNNNLTYVIDLPKYHLLKRLNNGIDRYWTKVS